MVIKIQNLPKNLPDCPILCIWIFVNFVLAKEFFSKALRSFETYVLVNNNLCGKLFPSLESPTTFDEIFSVIPVPFFILDFTILRLKCCIESFYIEITLKQSKSIIL